MREKEILIVHKVDQSHYNALRTYYMYRRKTERTKLMVIILLASLLLLVLSETAFGFPFFKLIGLTGVGVMAIMYSWISIDARRLEKYAQDIVNRKQELTLTSEGLSAKWKGLKVEEKYSWSELDYVYEDDFYFFLFLDRYSVIIISKIELKDPIGKEVRKLFESHVKLVSDITGYRYNI
ncbi:MAG: YcxB family protein [Eubacteriales bacterium]|nr:YcxB family protein [Eubacteriales bacterium]